MRRKPAMLSAAMRAARLYSSECLVEYDKCTTQSWDNCVRRPNLKSFFNAGNAAPPARLAEVVWVAEGLDLGSEANLHYAADDPPAEDDPSCASSVFQTWLHSRVDPQRAGTIF